MWSREPSGCRDQGRGSRKVGPVRAHRALFGASDVWPREPSGCRGQGRGSRKVGPVRAHRALFGASDVWPREPSGCRGLGRGSREVGPVRAHRAFFGASDVWSREPSGCRGLGRGSRKVGPVRGEASGCSSERCKDTASTHLAPLSFARIFMARGARRALRSPERSEPGAIRQPFKPPSRRARIRQVMQDRVSAPVRGEPMCVPKPCQPNFVDAPPLPAKYGGGSVTTGEGER